MKAKFMTVNQHFLLFQYRGDPSTGVCQLHRLAVPQCWGQPPGDLPSTDSPAGPPSDPHPQQQPTHPLPVQVIIMIIFNASVSQVQYAVCPFSTIQQLISEVLPTHIRSFSIQVSQECVGCRISSSQGHS